PRKRICIGKLSTKIEAAQKGEHLPDWRAAFAAQFSSKRKLRLIAQNHPSSFASGVSGRDKENPMAHALFHPSDFPHRRCRAQPYILGLLFKSGMENIGSMRWSWPFKPRNGNHRNGHNGNGHNGNGHDVDGLDGAARPDFLCVGAQKAGTSWLYRQLEPHPDFWMPPVKELHYLDNLNRTKRHRPPRSNDERDACFLESIKDLSMRSHIDLDSYGRLFCHKGPLLSGDISPAYSALTDE